MPLALIDLGPGTRRHDRASWRALSRASARCASGDVLRPLPIMLGLSSEATVLAIVAIAMVVLWGLIVGLAVAAGRAMRSNELAPTEHAPQPLSTPHGGANVAPHGPPHSGASVQPHSGATVANDGNHQSPSNFGHSAEGGGAKVTPPPEQYSAPPPLEYSTPPPAPLATPHAARSQRGDDAFEAAVKGWVAAVPQSKQIMSARELAVEFCRAFQHPDLTGHKVLSEWIEWHGYPLMCWSLGVIDPPPFDDFAHELATVMHRKRLDSRPGHAYRKGKGRKKNAAPAPVVYVIPAPPAEAVVIDLAAHRSA